MEVKILQKQARRKAVFQAVIDTTLQELVKASEDEEKRELGETEICFQIDHRRTKTGKHTRMAHYEERGHLGVPNGKSNPN